MSLHSIQINESVCTRLAIYADKLGVSWEEAIDGMLEECSKEDSCCMSGRPPEVAYHPDGEENFKNALLETKRAFIRIRYQDGSSTNHFWNAGNFTKNSSVLGNLRSGYLRSWREKGIVKAEVSVEPLDG
ncbi:MAG: hypothetical protein ACR2NQ_03145 [Thermodesulfobacteriota bacterium]